MAPYKALIYQSLPEGLPIAGKHLVVETRDMVSFLRRNVTPFNSHANEAKNRISTLMLRMVVS
jgi:hypothetical protein